MIRGSNAFFAAVILLAGCSMASAQDATIGAGKVELGGFPGGGTFLVGGDDNLEANFNVYTAGGGITFYLNDKAAFEGEITGSIGWAQDINYKNKLITSIQVPGVWSYTGNVLFFPQGTAGKRAPFYITAGVGLISLQPRVPTKPFGYDVDLVGWQQFVTESIGGGVKIFRAADAPNWGFRVDYRFMFVGSNSDSPPFFAQSKSRTGHRVYIGMLYTWKR